MCCRKWIDLRLKMLRIRASWVAEYTVNVPDHIVSLYFIGYSLGAMTIFGPDGGPQSLWSVVRSRNGVLFIRKSHNWDHGSELLAPNQFVILVRVKNDRR